MFRMVIAAVDITRPSRRGIVTLFLSFLALAPLDAAAQRAGEQVGMFIDSKGRRVLYDLRTQEILHVETARHLPRSVDSGATGTVEQPKRRTVIRERDSGAERIVRAPIPVERAPLPDLPPAEDYTPSAREARGEPDDEQAPSLRGSVTDETAVSPGAGGVETATREMVKPTDEPAGGTAGAGAAASALDEAGEQAEAKPATGEAGSLPAAVTGETDQPESQAQAAVDPKADTASNAPQAPMPDASSRGDVRVIEITRPDRGGRKEAGTPATNDNAPRSETGRALEARQNPQAPQTDQPAGTQAPNTEVAALPRPRVSTLRNALTVAAIQVVLDRAGASPGVIDGVMGSNVRKALDAHAQMTGAALDIDNEAAVFDALQASGGPAFMDYTITEADVAGPFIRSVPEDYAIKASLAHMSFTGVREMLAERFHMDEDFLAKLNPGVDFNRAGSIVRVTAASEEKQAQVARIVADKGRKQVRAYDGSGALVAAYPATIGSVDTPSPSGTVQVERIAFEPNYTYNPKINFRQGDNHRVLTVPPGPNGPVGTIWIALSKPTYGIHGTPEPSRIGKTYSNGCVRLTNWDAAELARMVQPGVTVEFVD